MEALQQGARQPARHLPEPGGDLPGAREVRPRPHRARRAGQARPGHRPRRGDPPRHPGAVAAHQEQPGADRRARRRQDRHRRGPRAAHRQAATCPRACKNKRIVALDMGALDRRRQVPRRVRGAPEGGAEGGAVVRGRDHPLHRRAAHRRRRRRGRGRDGRRNLLKPMLARGELHCIGATTLDEYRKHIEKDAALERRFQPVLVDQPTVEDTISILRGLRERYEVHHGVRIKDAALVAAAVLSNRYITDRFLPDKAIDLVDEAAAKPAHRDRLDARASSTRSTAASCSSRSSARRSRRRPTPPRSDRLTKLEKELRRAASERRTRCARSGRPRRAASQQAPRAAGADRADAGTRSSRPSAQYDLNKAAELKYGKLAELEKQLAAPRSSSTGRRQAALAQGGGRRGGHRRGRRALDRHPGRRSCSRASARSCSTWRSTCTSASSARTRRCSAVAERRASAPAPA